MSEEEALRSELTAVRNERTKQMMEIWMAAMPVDVLASSTCFDQTMLIDQIVALHTRIAQLEGAIKKVLTEKDDDLCWQDLYTELAGLVGIEFKPEMLTKEHMLLNCQRFVDSLLAGAHYEAAPDPRLVRAKQALEAWDAAENHMAFCAICSTGRPCGIQVRRLCENATQLLKKSLTELKGIA